MNILRFLINLLPKSTVMSGRGMMKGYKWVKGSGDNSYWMGTYEKEKVKIFLDHIKEGDIVFDIGAHAGYYSLLASEKAKKVYAFEPIKENCEYLKRNLRINYVNNVHLWVRAVSDKATWVYMKSAGSSSNYHISNSGDKWIPTVNLSIFEDIPNIIKMDAEGAEYDILDSYREVLEKHQPTIFVALHPNKNPESLKCFDLLKEYYPKVRYIGRGYNEILATA